jgi:hypothetical protein
VLAQAKVLAGSIGEKQLRRDDEMRNLHLAAFRKTFPSMGISGLCIVKNSAVKVYASDEQKVVKIELTTDYKLTPENVAAVRKMIEGSDIEATEK